MTQSRLRREDYTVGWISALPIEKAAATVMLDGPLHEAPVLPTYDQNNYTFGRIGVHNVVIACMPSGVYGTTSAAIVAESMMRTFTSLRFNLMVGIGGGAPNSSVDIRLGDVVVSTAVIQYDYGKTVGDGQFARTAFPVKPPLILLNAMSAVRANHISCSDKKIFEYLSEIISLFPKQFASPGSERDFLFESEYDHPQGEDTCALCDPQKRIKRSSRNGNTLMVHYGVIASANQVMKHGSTRERLSKELNVLCFEMEAAGLIDHFQCLTIRGICDYSDSHKNKAWQPYASATAAAYAKELLSVIHKSDTAKTEVVSTAADREACLKSLCFPEMNARIGNIDRETEGTCKWLLQHPRYRKWFFYQRGLLWIKGRPGAGKSTLLKYALRNRGRLNESSAIPCNISFFFHERGTELQKTPLGFYRSIVYQLLTSFPQHVAHLLRVFESKGYDPERHPNVSWTIAELQEITERSVLDVLQESPVRVYIDALDECGRESAGKLVQDFRRLLSRCASAQFGLSICFTCRHYPVISLDDGFTITVEQENRADISRFIRDEFDGKGLGFSADLEELQETMQQRSDGVFQWVALIVPQIADMCLDGSSKSEILRALRAMPQKLSGLYEEIVKKLQYPAQSLKLFQWICFAARPLSIAELRCAMNVDANPKYHSFRDWKRLESYIEDDQLMARKLRSLSGGLAEIKGGMDRYVVQFIHLSVNDYLLSEGFQSLDSALDSSGAIIGHSHTRLSRSCISYFANIEVHKALLRNYSLSEYHRLEYPFLEYARSSYLYHARKAEECGIGQEDLWGIFGKPSDPTQSAWVKPFPLANYLKEGPTVLHMASRSNLTSVVSMITRNNERKDVDINQQDDSGRTPLTCAVIEGHEAVVRILTAQIDVDVNMRDRNGYTPLMNAVYRGHEAIARLLIVRRELDMNVQDEDAFTALTYASSTGQEATVGLLLTREDIDINVPDEDGQTPLTRGTEHEAVVQLLTERESIDVNTQDKDGWTPLIHAVYRHNEAAVRALLGRKDLDVSIRDNDGNTALAHAICYNHQGIIRLVQARTNVEICLPNNNWASSELPIGGPFG